MNLQDKLKLFMIETFSLDSWTDVVETGPLTPSEGQPMFFKQALFFAFVLMGLSAQARFVFHEPKVKLHDPAPLFVVLHGFASSAEDIAEITRFSQWADQQGFYVLYPEAEDPNVFTKCWKYFLREHQLPKQGEAYAIIQEIERLKTIYPIDSQRIFLSGMSAGSSMASILAACYPDYFQGAAFHSGTSYGLSSNADEALIDLKVGPSIYRMANSACNPSDFKGKVLIFHSNNDEIVNVRHFDRYKKDFIIDTQSKSEVISETDQTFGYVQETHWQKGVIQGKSFLMEGVIHTWSGGRKDGKDKNGQPTKMGPDATKIILDFFLTSDVNRSAAETIKFLR